MRLRRTGRLAVDNASLRSALPTAPAFAHKLHSATYYFKKKTEKKHTRRLGL
jgi:hypothetical protein